MAKTLHIKGETCSSVGIAYEFVCKGPLTPEKKNININNPKTSVYETHGMIAIERKDRQTRINTQEVKLDTPKLVQKP